MAKPKVRIHREYFEPISKKKCPCEEYGKKAKGNQVYWWFEYHNVKRRTVLHFCKECFEEKVRKPLLEHAGPCGCQIEIVYKPGFKVNEEGKAEWIPQPDWLTLG